MNPDVNVNLQCESNCTHAQLNDCTICDADLFHEGVADEINIDVDTNPVMSFAEQMKAGGILG